MIYYNFVFAFIVKKNKTKKINYSDGRVCVCVWCECKRFCECGRDDSVHIACHSLVHQTSTAFSICLYFYAWCESKAMSRKWLHSALCNKSTTHWKRHRWRWLWRRNNAMDSRTATIAWNLPDWFIWFSQLSLHLVLCMSVRRRPIGD